MKLTVTPLERPSHAKRQGLHYDICVRMDACPNTPNTGAVFGRTSNTFGRTLSCVLQLFSTLDSSSFDDVSSTEPFQISLTWTVCGRFGQTALRTFVSNLP